MDSEVDKGQTTNKMQAEKENTIQLFKKKLKIPTTQLLQASELTVLEKEKDSLFQELNDSKSKLLKFFEEQGQWEKERAFLISKIDVLNENQLDLEREREEKTKNEPIKIDHPGTQTSTEAIV